MQEGSRLHGSSESVKGLFGDFLGYLQADASNVYDVLDRGPPTDTDEGVTLVACFGHLRRYFFEAAICRYPVGLHGLTRIRAIHAVDDAVGRAPATERPALRERHLGPLVKNFFDWARGPWLADISPSLNRHLRRGILRCDYDCATNVTIVYRGTFCSLAAHYCLVIFQGELLRCHGL